MGRPDQTAAGQLVNLGRVDTRAAKIKLGARGDVDDHRAATGANQAGREAGAKGSLVDVDGSVEIQKRVLGSLNPTRFC